MYSQCGHCLKNAAQNSVDDAPVLPALAGDPPRLNVSQLTPRVHLQPKDELFTSLVTNPKKQGRSFTRDQDEYAASDPEGKGAREYARSFVSSPGMRDGLYWPTEDETEPESPLGELVADAAIAGYRPAGGGGESSKQPFNGYYFRILNGQGSHASGGAYSYVINGRMMGGFAVIAWPAKYGASGFKTFMVNHDQTVYEADLGPDTKALVQEMQTFDPDEEWQKVEE